MVFANFFLKSSTVVDQRQIQEMINHESRVVVDSDLFGNEHFAETLGRDPPHAVRVVPRDVALNADRAHGFRDEKVYGVVVDGDLVGKVVLAQLEPRLLEHLAHSALGFSLVFVLETAFRDSP